MPKPNAAETLNELTQKVAERIERVANEGLTLVQQNAEALAKATEAQYKTGLDLVQKTTETARGLFDGELKTKATDVVDAAVDAARESADHWLAFAQSSLGNVRKLVETALQRPSAAA
jgi:hypothetical protein